MRVHVFVLLAMIVAVMDAAPRSQYYHYPAAGYYAGVAPPNYYYHPSYLNNPYHQRGPARPSLFNGFNGFHDFQLPPNPFRFIYEQFNKQVAKPIIAMVTPNQSEEQSDIPLDSNVPVQAAQPEEAVFVSMDPEEISGVLDGLNGGVAQAQFESNQPEILEIAAVEMDEPVTEIQHPATEQPDEFVPEPELVTDELTTEMAPIEHKPEDIMDIEDKTEEPILMEDKLEEHMAVEDKTEEPILMEDKPEEHMTVEDKTEEPILMEDKVEELKPVEDKTEEPILAEGKPEEIMTAEDKTEEPILMEDKTEEPMLTEDKPEEMMTVEDKPEKIMAAEDKPEELKPVEDKLEEAKPVDDKPAESEPAIKVALSLPAAKPEAASLTIESSNDKVSNIGQIHDEIVVSTAQVQIDTKTKPEPVAAAIESAKPVAEDQHREQLVLLGPPSEIEKIADVAEEHGEDCKVDYVVIEEGSDEIKVANDEQIQRIKAQEEKAAKEKETRFETRQNSRGKISIVFNSASS